MVANSSSNKRSNMKTIAIISQKGGAGKQVPGMPNSGVRLLPDRCVDAICVKRSGPV